MPDRLRFAPSPTGYLHVGGARTALFNWLYVRKYGGQFLLRIEDTDKARSTEESTRAIFDGMRWLGLDWNEEVVYQGGNVERHQRDAKLLLDRNKAYRCFCTAAELDQRRKEAESRGETYTYDRRCDRLPRDEVARRASAGEPFVIRFRVPEGTTSWDDLVHGTIAFPNKDVDDLVILRSDGTPIYNLAVVSDDIAMRITVVMRGDDHISNTPKQILLYEALGATVPRFAHLPMIHGADGKKLSKRHGATAVGDYEKLGILPGAMRNFLALLGWAPGNDIEVMSADEMTKLFSVEGLSKKAAIFDMKKLEWMNGQYLARMSADELLPLVRDALARLDSILAAETAQRFDTGWLATLIDLLKVRARTVDEIAKMATTYVSDDVVFDADAVSKHWKDRSATSDLLLAVKENLKTAEWDASRLESSLRSLAESRGTGAGKLFQPLRVALTGQAASPGMFDVLLLLGRERALSRIDAAIRYMAV